MPWGYAAGAVVGLAGDALKDDKNGGAGSSRSSSEPWAMAQPWLLQNLVQGQNLQNEYTARPFSARQQASYDNQYALSDYGRQLVPSLLNQLGEQPVGFDKNNRSARPKAWDWNALADGLGQRSVGNVQEPAAPAKPDKKFTQQDMGYTPLQERLMASGVQNPFLLGDTQYVQAGGINGGLGTGGYGSYVYGSTPKPGTEAYRDMTEYFLMGGNDPWNLAPGGMGVKRAQQSPWLMGGGGNSGNSVGGSAAADGSGGGGPGAF